MVVRKLLLFRSFMLIVLILVLFSPLNSIALDTLQFQKGMAFPTWLSEEYCSSDSDESLRLLVQNTCTEWIQLVPTWYQQDRYSHEIFPEYEGNTAKEECLRHAIRQAHSLGLKVMLTMPWNWQISGAIELKEQTLCYQAVIGVFSGKPWLAGIYWWNWEPDPRRGGVLDKGYTPQGKPAEMVLKRWYCQLSSKKGQKKC